MLNLAVVQFPGQNTTLLNRRDPGNTIQSCSWKAQSEKHLVSSNNDCHMQQVTISLVVTLGMAVLEPLSAYHCIRDEDAQEREGFPRASGAVSLLLEIYRLLCHRSLKVRVFLPVHQ